MWFESRRWGLEARSRKTGRVIAWITPVEKHKTDWRVRFRFGGMRRFHSHDEAVAYAEQALGERVKWWARNINGKGYNHFPLR